MEMGPACLGDVCEETRDSLALLTRQLQRMLRKKLSEEDVSYLLGYAMDRAIKAATEDAVEEWENTQTPCSAELFVQQYAELLWDQFLQEGGKYPYLFCSPPPFFSSTT